MRACSAARAAAGVCGAVFTAPSIASAHPIDPGVLTPANAWRVWTFEPAVVAILAASAVAYAIGVRRSARSTRALRIGRWRIAAFCGGWATLAIALISPLDAVAGALFWVHMVQHELLMIVAAPLIVAGAPDVAYRWMLAPAWRTRHRERLVTRELATAWTLATAPAIAWTLHAAAIGLWHIPQLFDAAVEHDAVHAAQHASFFGTALVFWWGIAHGRRERNRYGAGVVSVFTTAVYTTVLGALLTISPRVWYRVYADTTGPWGLTPLEDQQIGGLVMWVPASIVYTAAGLWLFAAWLRDSERQADLAVRRRRWAIPLAPVLLLVIVQSAACSGGVYREAAAMTGGDPQRGRHALEAYGCVTCHTIPGLRDARGLVGPPLTQIASRVYLAGHLPNTPDNMTMWIRHPREVEPHTAMPDTHVTVDDARDIAAYLYTLR